MRSASACAWVRLWSELRSQCRLAQSRIELHFQGGFVPSNIDRAPAPSWTMGQHKMTGRRVSQPSSCSLSTRHLPYLQVRVELIYSRTIL